MQMCWVQKNQLRARCWATSQLQISTNNANIRTSFTVWVDHLPLEGKEKEEREGGEEEEEEEGLVPA